MNGLDLTPIRLGETGIVLSLPLVQTEFFKESESIPAGIVGVVPDHPVSPTPSDIVSGRDPDPAAALRLIGNRRLGRAILGGGAVMAAVVAAAALLFLMRKTRKAGVP